MVYSFELIKHANIRYREILPFLARCELFAMLFSLDIAPCDIAVEHLGGSQFLTFECRELSDRELSYLSGHSSIVLMTEKKGSLLRPLEFISSFYLPEDLPEVLKYKGKTSPTFMRMMVNTSVALSLFRKQEPALTVFDPVCGKGTACFCAATAGMNAVGLDTDRRDIREAIDYFSRYLQYHRLKHEVRNRSETCEKHSVPVTEFVFANCRENYISGNVRRLVLSVGDTSDSPALFRKSLAHIITADLPYGIQHAPQAGSKPESLHRFLSRAVPIWKKVLMPGGVMSLSFNTLTLPSRDVRDLLLQSGFHLPVDSVFSSLTHEVEHAVVRDVIFALNTEEESVI